jgi:chromosome segregation ATPase
MFNFLETFRTDVINCKIDSVSDHIVKLENHIRKCKEKSYELDRELDHYEDLLSKAWDKKETLTIQLETVEEALTSPTLKSKQRFA